MMSALLPLSLLAQDASKYVRLTADLAVYPARTTLQHDYTYNIWAFPTQLNAAYYTYNAGNLQVKQEGLYFIGFQVVSTTPMNDGIYINGTSVANCTAGASLNSVLATTYNMSRTPDTYHQCDTIIPIELNENDVVSVKSMSGGTIITLPQFTYLWIFKL